MKKEDKGIIIEQIANTLKEYGCFYLAETAGLDAEKTSELRAACFKQDIKLMVVKNTLLHKALESLEGDYSEIYGALKGSTSVLFSNVGNAPAKLLKSMQKKDQTLPRFKAAYVEETIYVGEDQLETLSNIKSKNELIADVVALLQSPAKNVISALQSGGNTLHGVLETLSKKED
ncbi:50S ribosomal protein L10 [Turicimonas muris]|uniref:50S ribosomal protein L10 n=1 Tax=Turicimonas muris TaxID=1796652 RepID=UPI0026F39FBC|nr:50S ribosomal protein L10 [Turicimonas muris]